MQLKNTPKGANLVFLLTVFANIGFSTLIEFLAFFRIDIFNGSVALQMIYSQVLFVLPALLYLLITKTSFKLLRFKKIDILTILLCIVLYICISPVLNFINSVSLLYSTNLISDMMFSISDEIPFVVGLLIIAIVPAVFEEATYRGFYYNTYRQYSPLGAALMCGLLFGLMHGNLNQFTYACALGFVFALIVEATDSLWSTVTVHFLVNMSSVAIIYLLPKGLGILQKLYDGFVASGQTAQAEMIVNMLGTDEFTMDAVMGMSSANPSRELLLQAIASYAIPAVIGGVLAFFLYRFIAKRCGRWDIICGMFKRKSTEQPVAVQPVAEQLVVEQPATEQIAPEQSVQAVTPLVPEKIKFITWEFIVGAAIMVGQMALYEIIFRKLL